MSETARATAHAKINVRLKVLGAEASGFHSLETVFVRLALADTVTVRITEDGRTLDVSGDQALVGATEPAERNLALRAANTYAELTGWPRSFAIDLEKKIPVSAGLGGGSADAAAVLRALNLLAPQPCTDRELLKMAASLGADVPFLSTDHAAALAWGRGDRMIALEPLPEREVIILTPPFPVSTGDAYSWLDAARGGHPALPVVIPPDALRSWEALAVYAENDFEPPVVAKHPEIATMLAMLERAGAAIARLTGSGSSVFGIFGSPPETSFDSALSDWEHRRTRTLASVVPPERVE